jgi:hypothetical protein
MGACVHVVCMYVCMCVFSHMAKQVSCEIPMRVCVYVRVFTHVNAKHPPLPMCKLVCVHVRVCLCACVHVRMCVCM